MVRIEKAMKLAPREAERLRERASRAFDDRGPSAETAELFALLVRVDPRDGLAWFNLGDSLRAIGRLREAEDAFLAARELAPKSNRFIVDARLGMVTSMNASPAKAEKWFRLATAHRECPGWVWLLRASNLMRQESLRLARECLKAAKIRGDVDLDEVLLNEALIDRSEGDYESAARRAAEALEIDPGYEPARVLLAALEGAAEARRIATHLGSGASQPAAPQKELP